MTHFIPHHQQLHIAMVSGSSFQSAIMRGRRLRAQRSASGQKSSPGGPSTAPVTPSSTSATGTEDVDNVQDVASSTATMPASGTSDRLPLRLKHVLSIYNRAKIVRWIFKEANKTSEKQIASHAVRQFPSLFRSNQNSNLVRSTTLRKRREDYDVALTTESCRESTTTISRKTFVG